MKCSKCGSSEYNIFLGMYVISLNLASKKSENIVECDDCGFEWKWE